MQGREEDSQSADTNAAATDPPGSLGSTITLAIRRHSRVIRFSVFRPASSNTSATSSSAGPRRRHSVTSGQRCRHPASSRLRRRHSAPAASPSPTGPRLPTEHDVVKDDEIDTTSSSREEVEDVDEMADTSDSSGVGDGTIQGSLRHKENEKARGDIKNVQDSAGKVSEGIGDSGGEDEKTPTHATRCRHGNSMLKKKDRIHTRNSQMARDLEGKDEGLDSDLLFPRRRKRLRWSDLNSEDAEMESTSLPHIAMNPSAIGNESSPHKDNASSSSQRSAGITGRASVVPSTPVVPSTSSQPGELTHLYGQRDSGPLLIPNSVASASSQNIDGMNPESLTPPIPPVPGLSNTRLMMSPTDAFQSPCSSVLERSRQPFPRLGSTPSFLERLIHRRSSLRGSPLRGSLFLPIAEDDEDTEMPNKKE